MDPAVRLAGVVKSFNDHRAIDGLSIEVPRGSIFGLLGRNGAGKTTTIRMVMDIIRPDEGEIRVLGRAMEEGTKDRTGYLPEERGLYPRMKVLDMLQFHATVKNLTPAEARKKAGAWLERLELTPWAMKKVQELSKGMQQKVQFIAAVLAGPELLILDEPFSGMDPVNQDLFKDLILELSRGMGCTIIFSTHVMEQAERLCSEIALIDRGKAVLCGSLAAIKQRFGKNAVQLEFSGDGSFLKNLPAVERVDDYGQYSEILLKSGASPGAILEAAVPRLEIRRFEVMVPTLHSIFIQQVGGEGRGA
jgi:ABC-2 type transport system ATP-binding protein